VLTQYYVFVSPGKTWNLVRTVTRLLTNSAATTIPGSSISNILGYLAFNNVTFYCKNINDLARNLWRAVNVYLAAAPEQAQHGLFNFVTKVDLTKMFCLYTTEALRNNEVPPLIEAFASGPVTPLETALAEDLLYHSHNLRLDQPAIRRLFSRTRKWNNAASIAVHLISVAVHDAKSRDIWLDVLQLGENPVDRRFALEVMDEITKRSSDKYHRAVLTETFNAIAERIGVTARLL